MYKVECIVTPLCKRHDIHVDAVFAIVYVMIIAYISIRKREIINYRSHYL